MSEQERERPITPEDQSIQKMRRNREASQRAEMLAANPLKPRAYKEEEKTQKAQDLAAIVSEVWTSKDDDEKNTRKTYKELQEREDIRRLMRLGKSPEEIAKLKDLPNTDVVRNINSKEQKEQDDLMRWGMKKRIHAYDLLSKGQQYGDIYNQIMDEEENAWGSTKDQKDEKVPDAQAGGGGQKPPEQQVVAAGGDDEESSDGSGEMQAGAEFVKSTRAPENITEVCEGLMSEADPKFKRGGKYELVTYTVQRADDGTRVEIPHVNLHNYNRWLRDKCMTIRNNLSPNDSVNMWSTVEAKLGFNKYSFGKLYDVGPAWMLDEYQEKRDQHGNIILDQNGKPTYELELVTIKDKNGKPQKQKIKIEENGKIVEKQVERKKWQAKKKKKPDEERQLVDFRDNVMARDIYQATNMHTYETKFRSSQSSEDKFAGGLYDIFQNDDFTKNSTNNGFSAIYSLNDATKEGVEHFIQTGERGKVGYAAQIATLLYYNMNEVTIDPNHLAYYNWDEVVEKEARDKDGNILYIDDNKVEVKINQDGKFAYENGKEVGDQRVVRPKKIPRAIRYQGKEIKVNDKGIVEEPDKHQDLRASENLFEKALKTQVTLPGEQEPVKYTYGKHKGEAVDGVREFYSSLARQIIKERLSGKEGNTKPAYEMEKDPALDKLLKDNEYKFDNWFNEPRILENKSINNIISKAEEGCINWLDDDRVMNVINAKLSAEGKTLKGVMKEGITEKYKANAQKKGDNVDQQFDAVWDHLDGDNMKKFADGLLQQQKNLSIKSLNIFDLVNKEKMIVDMVRNAVRDTSAAKAGIEEIDDAKYAEFIVQPMWSFMGIYARNDLNAAGFMGWSKIMNFRKYRMKSIDWRSEKNGNLADLDLIKRLSLDPFVAWKVSKEGESDYDKTFLEELQGGEGSEMDFSKMRKFTFASAQQKQFAGNHIGNAAKIYKALTTEGMDFTRGLAWGPNYYPIASVDVRAGIGEKLHDIRYAFDLEQFKYNKKVHNPLVEDNGYAHYRDEKLKEAMLSDDVLNMDMYNLNSRTKSGEYRFEPKDKDKVGRNVFAALLSSQILSHRVVEFGQDIWSRHQLKLIEAFYKTFPEQFSKDEKGRISMDNFMFTDEEWKNIERQFRTPDTRGKDLSESEAIRWLALGFQMIGFAGKEVGKIGKLALRAR